MTIYDLPNEERMRVTEMIRKIIGRKEDSIKEGMTNSERIKARFEYDKLFEKLAKIWVNHGDKALAMNYTWCGRSAQGVTPGGKKWIFEMNSFGWTQRNHHCGSLYIEGEGTIFTSGTLARAFERILEK